jgi:hypothetical protein
MAIGGAAPRKFNECTYRVFGGDTIDRLAKIFEFTFEFLIENTVSPAPRSHIQLLQRQ